MSTIMKSFFFFVVMAAAAAAAAAAVADNSTDRAQPLSDQCQVNPEMREKCFEKQDDYVVTKVDCLEEGCCWDESASPAADATKICLNSGGEDPSNLMTCYKTRQPLTKCSVNPSLRVACGALNITAVECEAKGCCYNRAAYSPFKFANKMEENCPGYSKDFLDWLTVREGDFLRCCPDEYFGISTEKLPHCYHQRPEVINESNEVIKNCKPSDKWVHISICDNSNSTDSILVCTHSTTVGITNTEESSNTHSTDVSASITVTAGINVALLAKFDVAVTGSISHTWSHESSDSKTWNSGTTSSVQIRANPGSITQVSQLIGSCGPYRIATQQYRNTNYNATIVDDAGDVTITTIGNVDTTTTTMELQTTTPPRRIVGKPKLGR